MNPTESRKIAYVFRKKNPLFFSIENVFEIVINQIREKPYELARVEAPYYSTGILSVIRNILALRKLKSPVYHITGDIHYAVFAFPRNKVILTIHDCVFIHQAKGIKRVIMNWLFLKWPVWYAEYVTTISEASKREIINFSGCDPSKVIVIPDPFGNHIKFSPYTFRQHKPVLLFIGSTPNKNLSRTIESIKGINCHLEIVGKIPDDQLSMLNSYGIFYSQSERLTDQELNEKFAHCDVLVFPTLFEGFGLPILEAQQAGRPVLTSNLEPMSWVAGEGACLVDPTSVESIRQGLLKLLNDGHYRKLLVDKGLENLNRFSPNQISEQYLAVYQQMNEKNLRECKPLVN